MKSIKLLSYFLMCLLLSLLTIFTPYTAFATTSSLFIQNSNFEYVKSAVLMNKRYNYPDSWTSSSSFYSSPSTSNLSYDGEYSILVKEGQDLIISSSDITVESNKSYTFGIMAYPTSLSVSVELFISNGTKSVASKTFILNEINSWQKISLTADIPDEVTNVSFNLKVKTDSTSTCYFDGVFGTELESATIITTVDGASLRLATNSGIRFAGKVDKAFYDGKQNAVAGILIVPTDYLDGLNEFTFESLKKAGKNYLDIPAVKWNNQNTAESDGYYGFYCAITNVKPTNISRAFSAIAYVKYTENQKETILYGNYSASLNSRSIKQVATIASEYLESYSLEQQEIILYYKNYSA